MRTGKNTFITSSLGGYLECSVSNGVEHGNDFTYRVIARKDRSLLVISVLHHNGRIHVVEHDLIGPFITVMEVMIGFRYLYGSIQENVPFPDKH